MGLVDEAQTPARGERVVREKILEVGRLGLIIFEKALQALANLREEVAKELARQDELKAETQAQQAKVEAQPNLPSPIPGVQKDNQVDQILKAHQEMLKNLQAAGIRVNRVVWCTFIVASALLIALQLFFWLRGVRRNRLLGGASDLSATG